MGNTLFATAFSGFAWAIAGVLRRRFPVLLVSLGILVCSAALFVTEVVQDSSSWRVLILAAITLAPWTVAFAQCSGEWRRNPSPHSLALSLAWMAIILTSIARIG